MPGDPEEERLLVPAGVGDRGCARTARHAPGSQKGARGGSSSPAAGTPRPRARGRGAIGNRRRACLAGGGQGLRARLSYREAAGWLGYAHVWIHPHDLALRDKGLTSSYGVAFNAGQLDAAIPATAALKSFESAPSDIMVNQALQLAWLWRRLAEMRTRRPLADIKTVRETLQSLGCRVLPDTEIKDWMA